MHILPVRTLILILLPVIPFTGCDPATDIKGSSSDLSLVEENNIHARIDAYYRQQLTLIDYERQSNKTGVKSLAQEAFRHGTTLARGRSDEVSFAEAHNKAQKYIEMASGHPEEWIVGSLIGQTMLNWTIPYVRENVPDNVKLDYVELLVEGMSTEFPTIVTTLESVSGSKDRVKALAKKTLVNILALERIRYDDISKYESGLNNAQLTDDQRRQLKAHVLSLRTQWPPKATRTDGTFALYQPDIEAIRSRLRFFLSR